MNALIPNVSNDDLRRFTGGVMLFRLPCLETGPDWYYLFRHRVKGVTLGEDGSVTIEHEDLMPNRFLMEEWVEHPTNPAPRFFSVTPARHGISRQLPHLELRSPTRLYIRIDASGADAVIYADPADVPDDPDLNRDFPAGFEVMAGLGSIHFRQTARAGR